MSLDVTFASLSVEARTEVIKEAAEESAWAIESTDKKIARLADLLKQQKTALGHGKWIPWIKETFGDNDAAVWKVQRWMRGRANNAPAHYLELGDEPESSPVVVPRSERKTGRVEVVKSEVDEPGQQSVQPDENAVPEEPKTNTKHSKETAKAKEADRPAPMKVTPEIIDEPEDTGPNDAVEAYLEVVSPVQIVRDALTRISDDGLRVKEVRRIRKELDKFDPPTKFVKPTVDEVAEYCRERKNKIDPEAFVAHYATNGWKLSNGNKMADWKSAVITWEKSNGSGNRRAASAGSGRGTPITDF